MKKVAVVAYGMSSEKDISLLSGQGVLKALIKKGYDASLIKLTDNIAQFIKDIEAVKPDVIFNALHGKYGEDGCAQGLFNLMKIPYTHSGVLASALGMDKSYAKKIFASVGIPVAPELLVTLADIKAGKKIIIAAHGNSLRALVKYLDNISDADITELNIPTGMPLVYELDDNFMAINKEYLGDPEAVKKAMEAVANQGKKK